MIGKVDWYDSEKDVPWGAAWLPDWWKEITPHRLLDHGFSPTPTSSPDFDPRKAAQERARMNSPGDQDWMIRRRQREAELMAQMEAEAKEKAAQEAANPTTTGIPPEDRRNDAISFTLVKRASEVRRARRKRGSMPEWKKQLMNQPAYEGPKWKPPPKDDSDDDGYDATTQKSTYDGPRWKPPPKDDSDDDGYDATKQQSTYDGPRWKPPPKDDDSDDDDYDATQQQSTYDGPRWKPPPKDDSDDDDDYDATQQQSTYDGPRWQPPPKDDSTEEEEEEDAPPTKLEAEAEVEEDRGKGDEQAVAPTIASTEEGEQAEEGQELTHKGTEKEAEVEPEPEENVVEPEKPVAIASTEREKEKGAFSSSSSDSDDSSSSDSEEPWEIRQREREEAAKRGKEEAEAEAAKAEAEAKAKAEAERRKAELEAAKRAEAKAEAERKAKAEAEAAEAALAEAAKKRRSSKKRASNKKRKSSKRRSSISSEITEEDIKLASQKLVMKLMDIPSNADRAKKLKKYIAPIPENGFRVRVPPGELLLEIEHYAQSWKNEPEKIGMLRHVAVVARLVILKLYGENSPELTQFQEGLRPAFANPEAEARKRASAIAEREQESLSSSSSGEEKENDNNNDDKLTSQELVVKLMDMNVNSDRAKELKNTLGATPENGFRVRIPSGELLLAIAHYAQKWKNDSVKIGTLRQVAVVARLVIMKLYGANSPELTEFQEGLRPAFS